MVMNQAIKWCPPRCPEKKLKVCLLWNMLSSFIEIKNIFLECNHANLTVKNVMQNCLLLEDSCKSYNS